ncbi:hypothetical protein CsSME_00026852 [Camellia sinensis var. sinensis]
MEQYAKGFLMFSFAFFRHYFDTVAAHEIMWQPWAMMPTVRLLDSIIPMSPPESMRSADSLSVDTVTQFMVGLDADYFRAKGDYTTFIQTHLMPPLTGVRGSEGAKAPIAREVRRATRARARGAPPTGQGTGWLEFPTAFTCWQHTAVAYQVPIEPAATSHELVGASIEYTGSALELIASLMGMVQKRETLLGLHAIPVISFNPGYTDCSGGSSSISTMSRPSESSKSGDDNASSGSESRGDDVEAGSGAKSGDDADSSSGSETDLDNGDDRDSAFESSPSRKRTKRAFRA